MRVYWASGESPPERRPNPRAGGGRHPVNAQGGGATGPAPRRIPMMPRLLGLAILAAAMNPTHGAGAAPPNPGPAPSAVGKIEKTDAEWRRVLTPDQYRILRRKGTEAAFTGGYWNQHAKGTYRCAGCGLELFDSADKFDSGTGWPSFRAP